MQNIEIRHEITKKNTLKRTVNFAEYSEWLVRIKATSIEQISATVVKVITADATFEVEFK